MNHSHDPLLELEKALTRRTFFGSLLHTARFLTAYLALSGLIF